MRTTTPKHLNARCKSNYKSIGDNLTAFVFAMRPSTKKVLH